MPITATSFAVGGTPVARACRWRRVGALRCARRALRPDFTTQEIREGMDRGIVEHFDQRDSRAEPVLQLAVHSRQEQGIAAQVEEVVVNSDLLEAEDFLPDRGDLLFDFALRDLTPLCAGQSCPPLQLGNACQNGSELACGEPPTQFPALQLADRRLGDRLLRNG